MQWTPRIVLLSGCGVCDSQTTYSGSPVILGD